MKITFYYVRHGETLFNRKGRIQGVCDSPLTENGKKQVIKAKEALKDVYFDRAFTSPSERTMDTASIILEGRKLEAEVVDNLHEYDFGRFEGTRFTSHPDEIRNCFETKDFSSVDGESRAKIEVRVRETIRRIVDLCEDNDRVLLTGHGMFEDFLMATLLDVDTDKLREEYQAQHKNMIPNGGIMVFQFEDGLYKLISLPVMPEDFVKPEEEKVVTFYYVRHGETQFNMWNRMQGSCDSPLTQNGIHQAEMARDALKYAKIDLAFTSTSGRTRKTAEIVCQPHNIKPQLCKGLKEVDFGDFDGIVTDSWQKEIMKRHETESWEDVGGESPEQIKERIETTLYEIANIAKDGESVLLVSHGTYYLNMLRFIFNIDRMKYYEERMKEGRQAMPNGGVFTFQYIDGQFKVLDLMIAPDEFLG